MSVFIEMRTIILLVFLYLASSTSSEEVPADRNITLRAYLEGMFAPVETNHAAIEHVARMGAHHDDFQRHFEEFYSVCSANGEKILCPDVQQLKASNPNYTLVDVIQLLVDEGADINAKAKFSESSIFLTLRIGSGHIRISMSKCYIESK
ncbi:uncharacterized protein LOC119074105 [Bradysia coprophila]|uniref:uncharacterized protein LOC119074105 n=1 Tax=Bradysia coprophila TaxID=38358 RepID=UPI00187DA3F4|nr:uncharacterized protein LOC119074105 [Bradysia coprophila]